MTKKTNTIEDFKLTSVSLVDASKVHPRYHLQRIEPEKMSEKDMQAELTRRRRERLKSGPPQDPGPCPEGINIQDNPLECADWLRREFEWKEHQAGRAVKAE